MNTLTTRINVLVKPRASRESVEGWEEGTLVVRLTALPVEDAANKALLKLLAVKAGVAKSRIKIISGEKRRAKVLQLEGITIKELKERLG
jgi:uncharacterized protein (TIGR00251 family)